MNQNLLSRVLEFLRRKMWNKRWQRAVTCLAAVAVFGVVYALIMPAITLSGPHPEINAEKLTAWSGDGLTLHVTAEAVEEEHDKVFVLSMDETGADLDEKYEFNEEGIALIKAKDEAENELELQLHRSVRENTKKDQVIVDYWFTLDAGTKVEFDLDLLDEVDETRFSEIVETVKKTAEKEAIADEPATASDAGKAAVVTEKEEAAGKASENGATASDAVKVETAKASGSNADVAEANAAAKSEEEKIVVEKDDDGFEQILDGAIVNDLAQDDEFEAGTVVTAALKVSAGNGEDLEAARKDADKNADKRQNAQLKFQWKDYEAGRAVSGELVKNIKDATIAVFYDEDAGIPEGAYIDAREIDEGTEEYQMYYAQAQGAVAAGAERDVSTARFFDIKIVDADGNEIEPQAEVKVVITYGKENGTAGSGDLNLLHFHENEEAETVSPQNVIRDEGSEALSFTTDRFSVFGCVYTVDFLYVDENGNPYAWSFPGKGSYGLNTVLAEMGINAEIEDASLKHLSGQNEEGSLYLTSEGGWTLHSDKAFKDTYELTVLAGNKGYKIRVTDAAGDTADWLADDWVRISMLKLNAEEGGIVDGLEPFDNVDENNHNREVRTYDIVKYNLFYETAIQAEADVDYVKEGYLCFRMILPSDNKTAVWNTDSMGWIGADMGTKERLDEVTKEDGTARANGESAYYTYTDDEGRQIIEGKRYLTGTGTNPYVFPGSGTCYATIQVLMPNAGTEIQPIFEMWMDHNDIENETCEEHGIAEKKTLIVDPVTVVSELRMNVDLKPVVKSYSSYYGEFTFNDPEVSAGTINYDKGTLSGSTAIYGLTVQLYNRFDDNKGLKGCALPVGPVGVDLSFTAKYKPNNSTETIDLTELGYTPLVYSFGTNDHLQSIPGRPIPSAISDNATGQAPYDTRPQDASKPFTDNTEGTYRLWNGGSWEGSQQGSTAHFEVKDYIINPNFFPNSRTSTNPQSIDYWDYTKGVRNCDVGSFAAAKIYVVYPETFVDKNGSTVNILEKWGPGTISTGVDDINLTAKDSAGNALPSPAEAGNDNQKCLTDDHAAASVYLSPPGSYSSIIRYTYKYNSSNDTDNLRNNVTNGRDTAALGQEIGLMWTLNASTNGRIDNMISAAQSLIKFDADLITLGTEKRFAKKDGVPESVTFLYGAKQDGRNWTNDDEMNSCQEKDLIYYPSPEAAEAEGKKCVAILAEWRFPDDMEIYSNYEITAGHQAFVKTDESLAGKAYPIIYYCDFWNREDMRKLELSIENFPSRTDPDAVMPGVIEDGEIIDNAQWKRAAHRIQTKFHKAVYEDGVFKEDQNGIHLFGDTLYVVNYKASISKLLKQLNAAGTKHTNFDLDNYQRVADYVLTVDLNRDYAASTINTTTVTITDVLPKGLAYIPGSAYYGGTYTQRSVGRQGRVSGGRQMEPTIISNDDGGQTLTWIIENAPIEGRLPDIYYSCDIGNPGGRDDVKNGDTLTNTVTVMTTEDVREPDLVNRKLATETLTISKTIETSVSKVADRKYIEADEKPAWTAYVGNNGTNAITNTIMLDTMPVNGDENGSSYNENSILNIHEWTIDTTAATNVSTWKAYYTTSEEAKNTRSSGYIYVADTDDTTGEITGFHLEGNPESEEYEKTKDVVWSKVSIEIEGSTASIPELKGIAPTAVAVVGTLNAKETYKAHIVVEPSEGLFPGDRMVNQISRGNDIGKSTVYVVNRALEGIVWLDANRDGIRGIGSDAEDAIQYIPVQLLKLKENGDPASAEDYEPVEITRNRAAKYAEEKTGEKYDIIRDLKTSYDLYEDETDIGRYRFEGLHAGTYGIRFLDDLETAQDKPSEFFQREGTLQNAGSSDMYDSDAATTYYGASETRGERENYDTERGKAAECIKHADILGIVMPEINNMASQSYISRYNDYGIYDAVGSLKIKKSVTYNGTDPAELSDEDKEKAVYRLAGDYTFEIYEDAELSKICMEEDGKTPRTVTLTIGEGLEPVSKEITNLKAGTYWIMEVTPTTGALPVQNPVEVTVQARKTAEEAVVAEFTNNYDQSSGPDDPYIIVRKLFYGIDKEQIPAGFTITVTDGKNTYELKKGNYEWSELSEDDIETDEGKVCGWQWIIRNVKPGSRFTIDEQNQLVPGYADPVTTGTTSNATVPAADVTFTTAKPEIATENNHLNWPAAEDCWFAASLTNSGGEKGTLIVSMKRLSQAERNAVEIGSDGKPSLLSVLRRNDSNVWKTPVYYYSVETYPEGFPINGGMVKYDTEAGEVWFTGTKLWQHTAIVTVTGSESAENADFTVTNTYTPVETEINVLKVDKTGGQSLTGAEFQLYRYSDNTYTTPYDWAGNKETNKWPDKAAVDTDGKLEFEGLTAGYYKLVEVKAPKGYILMKEPAVQFEVKVDDNDPKKLAVVYTDTDLVAYTAADKTFTVKNEPGTPLPNTGGTGTLLYKLGGMMLMMAGLALYGFRMKKGRGFH